MRDDEQTQETSRDAGREIEAFSEEFGNLVDDLPAQRALKDVDKLLEALDHLVGRTVHLGSAPSDPASPD